MAGEVQVQVEAVEEVRLPAEQVIDLAARAPRVAEPLGEIDPQQLVVSEPDDLGREENERSPFRATVYDRASNRALEVAGRLDAPGQLQVRPRAFALIPRPAELREALEVLRRDDGLAPLAGREDVRIYQPMPPFGRPRTR